MTDTTKYKNHILPLSLYLSVGTTLLVLTAITVWAAQIDFGSYNLVIAMAIAVVKATLVAMFFMHLKYDNKLYLMYFMSAIFFLATFIIITMFDTLYRGDIYEIKAGPINKDAIIYQDKSITDSSINDSSINDSSNVIVDSLTTNVDSLNISAESGK